jgi:diguanylate cyclase (GGDEF)-like protein
MAVDRAHRAGEPLVIAYVDVDHLKRVNDVQGHASGDRLLREVGSALRQGLRSYDVVGRYGGDEFVCALPGACLPEADRRFADVAKMLSNAIAGASVSIGLAQLRDEESLEEVIGRADREMYDCRRRIRPTRPGAQ